MQFNPDEWEIVPGKQAAPAFDPNEWEVVGPVEEEAPRAAQPIAQTPEPESGFMQGVRKGVRTLARTKPFNPLFGLAGMAARDELRPSRPGEAPPERKFDEEIGAGLAAGTFYDLPETVARAGRTLTRGAGMDGAGQALGNVIERSDNLRALEPSHGARESEVVRSVSEGVRSIPVSAGTALPGMLAGSIGGPLGLAAGAAASGGTIFGLAEYDRFLEEAQKQGIDPESVKPEALAAAVTEGGLEGVSNLLDVALMKVGRPATAPAKNWLKRLAGNYLKVALSEVPTEMTQEAAGQAIRREAGMQHQDPWEAAKRVVGPTLVTSAGFAGAGTAAGGGAQQQSMQDQGFDPSRIPTEEAPLDMSEWEVVRREPEGPAPFPQRQDDFMEDVAREVRPPVDAGPYLDQVGYDVGQAKESAQEMARARNLESARDPWEEYQEQPVGPVGEEAGQALERAQEHDAGQGEAQEPALDLGELGQEWEIVGPAPEQEEQAATAPVEATAPEVAEEAAQEEPVAEIYTEDQLKRMGKGALNRVATDLGIEKPARIAKSRLAPMVLEAQEQKQSLQGRAQAVTAAPAIAPDEKINGITREEAGRMMAEGDESVVEHVREGVALHGKMPVEDAVRNEALRQVAETPAGPERDRVRENIARLEPVVGEALSGAPPVTPTQPQEAASEESGTMTNGGSEKAVTALQDIEVKKDGTPMTRRGANLMVARLFREGVNAEAVQLDQEGKAWGIRREVVEEAEDKGPAMDRGAQKAIRKSIEDTVPAGKDGTRDYEAMLKHADTLIDEQGYSVDDVYEVVNQIEEAEGVAPRFARSTRKPTKGMKRDDVLALVDRMQREAATAPELTVVQSMDDLPRWLRERARRSKYAPAAIFDPVSKASYFVAGNIGSPADVLRLWRHEQGGHGGLLGLVPNAEQHRNLLNLVKDSVPRRKLRAIMKRLGLSNTLAGKLEAAEEYVAELAEKVSRDDVLIPKERTLWQRIVRFVQRAWSRVLGRPLSLDEIESMVVDAMTYTVHGESTGAVRGLYERETGEPVTEHATAQEARFARTKEPNLLGGVPEDQDSDFWATAKELKKKGALKPKDVKLLESIIRQPYWLAKDHKGFAPFLKIEQDREGARTDALLRSWKEVDKDLKVLDKQGRKDLAAIIWQIEGKKLKDVEVDKFVKDGQDENGHQKYRVNERHYEQLHDALVKAGAPEDVARAVVAIRRTLDRDMLAAYNRLRRMREGNEDAGYIEEYRTMMGQVHNYFPHIRRGTHYVRITDKKTGETLWRQHFNAAPGMKRFKGARALNKALADIRKDNPGAELAWDWGKNEGLPEDVYGYTIPVDAMEQIINAAVDRKGGDKETRGKLKDLLHESVADVLKTRGWSRHTIKRQGIPGHETEDIAGLLWDYKAGLYGWLTKMDAAKAFTDELWKIDARKTPRLYSYSAQYVQDMLRNSDRIDQIVSMVKSAAFLKYLGGNLKTASLNLTQNIVAGVPRLYADTSVRTAAGYYKAALDDIANEAKVKTLKGDEKKLLEDLYYSGVTADQYMRELQGEMRNVGGAVGAGARKVNSYAGAPMSLAERFNRCSLALAAYRAARGGKITNAKTMEAFGKKPGDKLDYEQAKEFAETIVYDSHFMYGKANRPGLVRGGKANRLLSAAYTFRTFSHGLLSLWRHLLTQKGWQGRRAFALSLASQTALGGLTSLPLYALVVGLIRQLFGEDPVEKAMKLTDNQLMRDVMVYGLPAVGGVSISGSLGMELPVFDSLEVDKPITGQVRDKALEVVGIPWALIEDMTDAAGYAMEGKAGRAAEKLAPAAIANAVKAWRLYDEGSYTESGRPINVPGKTDAMKLTAKEAVAQALGFYPVRRAKSYDLYRTIEDLNKYRTSKQGDLVKRFLEAVREKDDKARAEVVAEWRAWNKRMRDEGRPEFMIDPLPRLAGRRRNARQPVKRMRGRAQEMKETYGLQ